MTTRTWYGSQTNNASDPNAWSPGGVPVAGDTLLMTRGGMNVTGDDLAGDPVHVTNNQATAVFNLYGPTADLTAIFGGYTQFGEINVEDGTTWTGGFSTYPQCVVDVVGPGTWDNTQTSINGSATIAPNVEGTGTISVREAHSTGTVEFKGGVGAGQTVGIDGYATYGGQHGVVVVDDPATYQATTHLAFGELHLQGLHADSYSQDGSTLTLYDGGQAVDTLNLTTQPAVDNYPEDFGVSQAKDGVVIHNDNNFHGDIGTPIPKVPPPSADYYQYLPPGGTLSPPTSINNHTLAGGPGAYSIHATGLQFIAPAFDEVGFTQGSNFDLTIQSGGGVVSEGGSWNLAIANSGATAMLDNNAANGHNMFVVGSPVTTALAEMQPTDNLFLQGVSQADIDAAFQNLTPNAQSEAVLNLPRAGGSALSLVLPNQASAPLLAAQFHGF